MDLSEYQDEALVTAVQSGDPIHDLCHYAFGASDEAGEIAGAMKKYLRGDFGTHELRRRLKGEIGDTLWYLAVLADDIGFDLSEVAEGNIKKLRDRDERGKITGDGDNR